MSSRCQPRNAHESTVTRAVLVAVSGLCPLHYTRPMAKAFATKSGEAHPRRAAGFTPSAAIRSVSHRRHKVPSSKNLNGRFPTRRDQQREGGNAVPLAVAPDAMRAACVRSPVR